MPSLRFSMRETKACLGPAAWVRQILSRRCTMVAWSGAQSPDTPEEPERTIAEKALITPEDMSAAYEAFTKELRCQVDWISEKCYEGHLLNAIKKLSSILEAGKKLGVLNGKTFFNIGICNDPYTTLHPIKVLGMKKQVRDRLLEFLDAQGVDMVTIFNWAPKTSKD